MRCPRTILLFACLAVLLIARPSAAVRIGETDYDVDTWTIHEGLPSNVVRVLDVSPDGYLWIVTHSGLARFRRLEIRSL